MGFIGQFVTRHPIISFLIGLNLIDGAVAIAQTIAYAISGREGLNPNKEENENESAATAE